MIHIRIVPIGAEGIAFITKKQHKTIIYQIQQKVWPIAPASLKTDLLFTHAKKREATFLAAKKSNMNTRIPTNLTGTVYLCPMIFVAYAMLANTKDAHIVRNMKRVFLHT
jgi:hypothetical protein